jgi:hypothetical protein
VVHVPVEDQQLVDAVLGLQRARRDRHVVEQAEAHRTRGLGVVPRRTHGREARAHAAARDRAGEVDRRAGREPRCEQALAADEGVLVELRRRRATAAPTCVEQRALVHAQDLSSSAARAGSGVEPRPLGIQRAPRRPGARAVRDDRAGRGALGSARPRSPRRPE